MHPEAVILPGASWRNIKFPSTVGLIRHPSKGVILFDTGYAKHFSIATSRYPERLYAKLTPVTLTKSENLILQLAERNIAPQDVQYIFISHFHADHIAGLQDFPQAKYICSKDALNAIKSMGRFRGLTKGYLKELLPANMDERTTFIENSTPIKLEKLYRPFDIAYDLFGDGSLLAINLPGHAHGHFGLLIPSTPSPIFLVGDACWVSQSYEKRKAPRLITSLIMNNRHSYLETLYKISDLYYSNSSINIVPSHCLKKFQDLNKC